MIDTPFKIWNPYYDPNHFLPRTFNCVLPAKPNVQSSVAAKNRFHSFPATDKERRNEFQKMQKAHLIIPSITQQAYDCSINQSINPSFISRLSHKSTFFSFRFFTLDFSNTLVTGRRGVVCAFDSNLNFSQAHTGNSPKAHTHSSTPFLVVRTYVPSSKP